MGPTKRIKGRARRLKPWGGKKAKRSALKVASTTSEPEARTPYEPHFPFLAALGLGQTYGLRNPENSQLLGEELLDDLNDKVAPRDPLERMLLQQLAWCHVRILRLSIDSSVVNDRCLAVHELCDKAMNSFRRGILALGEYRRAAAKSPHIASQEPSRGEEQQVVVATNGLAGKNTTNELGANHGKRATDRSKPAESTALEMPHSRRFGAASTNGAFEDALAQVNGTSNGRRETPVKPERPQARRSVLRSRFV